MAKTSKATKKKPVVRNGTVFLSGWLDAALWQEIRDAAQANDRTLIGEVNHRLRQTSKLRAAAE